MVEEEKKDPQVYDTHKFLFTLYQDNKFKDHKVLFIDRNNEEKTILLKDLEITSSPVSCKLYDEEDKKHIVPFIRIRKIFNGDELVWDNTDTDLSNVKVIKGYK